jgi:bifunctional DNase/RNase
VRVDRVEVHDVRNNTFYAMIYLVGPRKKTMAIDSRPSDAIALALRTGARICVAKKVIERTRRIDMAGPGGVETIAREAGPADADAGQADEAARLRELLESLSDDEFGKWKM